MRHAGLIERQSHAADRRVILTACGRELQGPLVNQDFLGQFPPQEAKLLRELLTSIAQWKGIERGANAQE
jgi:DNA-binding MarR family transcriptional regulator